MQCCQNKLPLYLFMHTLVATFVHTITYNGQTHDN